MALIEHSRRSTESAPVGPEQARGARNPRAKRGAIVLGVAVVLSAAGAGAWLALHDDAAPAKPAPAATVSAKALRSLAASVGHPVYWAGPEDGYRYELTHTTDGRIYIRYLPAGAAVGSSAPDYLTVGTYPVANALTIVRAIGAKTGGSLVDLGGGAVAAADPDHPLSMYIAYPGSAYEVEVYAPSPGRSRQLVTAGAIVSAGTGRAPVAPIKPTAASVADLRALVSSSGYPIYWAGPQAGQAYELSELSDGRIYVRYLPKGVQPGAQEPLPTVGTYPVPDAFAAVQVIAKRPGATQIRLSNGGIAVTDPAHPTSVYLAYPHGTVEVEVFDPSPARARELVRTGVIVPVV
jgi:hypothetical protein